MQTRREFYRSGKWRKLVTSLQLARAGQDGELRCAHCGKPIVHKYDCVGHHVLELTDSNVQDPTVSLNPDNIVLVHHRCHNAIHDRFVPGAAPFKTARKVYLVYGSPCSGKSTWVENSAGPNDLVVDMDRIYDAIGTKGRYDKSGLIKSNVFAVRNLLLDQIRTRYGQWRNAYIIGGYPLLMDRQRLLDATGAESVFVDTDRQTCEARAKMDRPGAWMAYIDSWWREFRPDPPPVE